TAVLLERLLKTHQRPVAPSEPHTVDRQVVDQARIEGVRRLTAVPGHARRGLLRQTQQWPEGADVLGQDRFVAEVAGDLGEAREEFVPAHRRLGGSGPLAETTRQLDPHRGLLLPRLYAQPGRKAHGGGPPAAVSPTGGTGPSTRFTLIQRPGPASPGHPPGR